MQKPARQITITVHIHKDGTVSYLYFDPSTGVLVESNKCDLHLKHRTCCLFVLDDKTAHKGWLIKNIYANGTSCIEFERGPYELSIGTMFENLPKSDFKFYIVYHNCITQKTIFIDPQEVNVPPR